MASKQNPLCTVCYQAIELTHDVDNPPDIISEVEYIGCISGHLAHRSCIQEWIITNDKCPICHEQYDATITEQFEAFKAQKEEDKKREDEEKIRAEEERQREEEEAKNRIDPDVEATVKRANLLSSQGNHKDAINALWDTIDEKNLPETDKSQLVLVFTLGIMYQKINKSALAIQQLNKVVKGDPTYPKAFEELANAYDAVGMYDKAQWARERIFNQREDTLGEASILDEGAALTPKGKDKKEGLDDNIIVATKSANPFFAGGMAGPLSTEETIKEKKISFEKKTLDSPKRSSPAGLTPKQPAQKEEIQEKVEKQVEADIKEDLEEEFAAKKKEVHAPEEREELSPPPILDTPNLETEEKPMVSAEESVIEDKVESQSQPETFDINEIDNMMAQMDTLNPDGSDNRVALINESSSAMLSSQSEHSSENLISEPPNQPQPQLQSQTLPNTLPKTQSEVQPQILPQSERPKKAKSVFASLSMDADESPAYQDPLETSKSSDAVQTSENTIDGASLPQGDGLDDFNQLLNQLETPSQESATHIDFDSNAQFTQAPQVQSNTDPVLDDFENLLAGIEGGVHSQPHNPSQHDPQFDELVNKCRANGLDPSMTADEIDLKGQEIGFQMQAMEDLLEQAQDAATEGHISLDEYQNQENMISEQLKQLNQQIEILQQLRLSLTKQ